MTPDPAASEYLVFVDASLIDAKTRRLLVVSRRSGDRLGEIKWFGRWRQYAFFPADGTVWNPQCMVEINEQIRVLMDERKHPVLARTPPAR